MTDGRTDGYLFHNLLNSNISTKFVNVVKSMFSTVNACVRRNSTYSTLFGSLSIYLSIIFLQTIELLLYPIDYAEILMYILIKM